jgi:HlyD family secretion protein
MKNIYNKVNLYVRSHKWLSGIVLIVIVVVAYFGLKAMFSTSGDPSYVTTTATTGSVVSSVTGTGQVSTSNQLELTPQASGNVVYIGVTDGETVTAGTLIAELDTTTAEKSVRDAEASLQSAQLSYQKLTEPADTLSVTQAQDALASAQTNLSKSYDDGFNDVSNTFLDLPSVMSGLNSILYGTTVNPSGGQNNLSAYADMASTYSTTTSIFEDNANADYQTALTSYNQSLLEFQSANRFSSTSTTEQLVGDTYNTTKVVAEAVKSANDFLNFVKQELTQNNKNIPTILTTHQNSLSTYTGEISGHVVTLLSDGNTITSSQYALTEQTESLAKLQAGADPLDVQSSQLNITQAQNALTDAKNNLANYYVYAPYDGTVAKVNVQVDQSAGSGTSVATFITQQKIAEVSLNEVDAAKIQNGQKVTLTFDALPDLSIAGVVDEVDTVGTVSQGVVTYNVKIGFDTQDARVKSGMSVNAAIVTAIDQNVVTVPSSAVKTSGSVSYVQIFNPPLSGSNSTAGAVSKIPPVNQVVTVGLSDGTNTEITSGLKVGDQVVTRTIAGSGAKTTTSATPSLLGGSTGRVGGGAGGFGGGVRIGG